MPENVTKAAKSGLGRVMTVQLGTSLPQNSPSSRYNDLQGRGAVSSLRLNGYMELDIWGGRRRFWRQKKQLALLILVELTVHGGERGIRTPDTVIRIHAFQAGPFSHSGISPQVLVRYRVALSSERCPL